MAPRWQKFTNNSPYGYTEREQHFFMNCLRDLKRRFPIHCLPNHLDIGLRVQQHSYTGANDDMIFDDAYTNWRPDSHKGISV